MNIDPCAGIGGAYVIDPKTGERIPAGTPITTAEYVTADEGWAMIDSLKKLTAKPEPNEPLDPIAA